MAVAIARTANPAGVAGSANVVTYSNASIGAAADDRIVAVCVTAEVSTSGSINSATIDCGDGNGDQSMSANTEATLSGGSVRSRIFYKRVPVGTTATIKVTFGANPGTTTNHITVYRVTGADLTLNNAGTNVSSTDMDSTAPLSTGAITIPTGGGFLGVVCGATATTTAKTWANVTEDLEANAGSHTHTTALRTTALTSTAVTCTGTTNGEDGAMSWVIFKQGYSIWAAKGDYVNSSGTTDLIGLHDPLVADAGAYTFSISDQVTRDFFLPVDAGALALTGIAADLPYVPVQHITFAADAGAYAVSNIAALFPTKRTAATGAHVLTGQPATFGIKMVADAGGYALNGPISHFSSKRTASGGAHVLTGVAVNFGVTMPAVAGAYALTVNDAVKRVGMPALAGSYAVNGVDALRQIKRTAAVGSYALSGVAATFGIKMPADAGAYALNAPAVGFGVKMPAATGVHALTGTAATLTKTGAQSLSCDVGAYALSGQPALAKRVMLASLGSYTFNVNAIVERVGMVASPGAYALTGLPMTPSVATLAALGAINLTGRAATLTAQRKIAAATGALTVSGRAANLSKIRIYSINVDVGVYAFSISDRVTRDYLLKCATGAHVVSGKTNAMRRGRRLACATGARVINGIAANLKTGRKTAAGIGAFSLAGSASGLTKHPHLIAISASYAMLGKDTGLGNLRILSAQTGDYHVTGLNASRGQRFAAIGGSFAIGGNVAALSRTSMRTLVASGGAYTVSLSDAISRDVRITAEAGSLVVGGVAANVTRGRRLAAAAGGYAFAGIAATANVRIALDAGSYAVTGPDVQLDHAVRYMFAAGGHYTWRISDIVVPERLPQQVAAAGAYALTGQAAGLSKRRAIACDRGIFTIIGPWTGLGSSMQLGLTCSGGAYALSLAKSYSDFSMAADAGSIARGGSEATLSKQQLKILLADTGAYALSGHWAQIDKGTQRRIVASGGAYALELARTVDIAASSGVMHDGAYGLVGMPVDMIWGGISYQLSAECGSYVTTGSTSHRDLLITADAGAVALNGAEASVRRGLRIAAETGVYSRAGTSAAIFRGRGISLATGSLVINGVASTFRHALTAPAAAGAYAVTGIAASFVFNRMFVAAGASYAVNGRAANARAGRRIVAATGNILRIGNPVTWAYSVQLAGGAFTLNGRAVILAQANVLGTEIGSYSVTGIEIVARVGRKMKAAGGVFAVGGQPVSAPIARRMSVDAGAYARGTPDIMLERNRRMTVEGGAYVSTINPSAYARSVRLIEVAGGRYKVEGDPIGMRLGETADIEHWKGRGHGHRHIHGRGPITFVKGNPGRPKPFRGKE